MVIASIWQSLSPVVMRGGSFCSLLRRDSSSEAHSSRVSGVWKAKSLRDLVSGSFRLLKKVSVPVLSYAKGRGFWKQGRSEGREQRYLSD